MRMLTEIATLDCDSYYDGYYYAVIVDDFINQYHHLRSDTTTKICCLLEDAVRCFYSHSQVDSKGFLLDLEEKTTK